MPDVGDRHAFISYVREDSGRVDRMHAILEAAGIRVWRDTADLWPGEDWRLRIRQAITDDALAFIACFSNNSAAREASGQNEELVLAVDQLRRRLPGDPWLIPVRFDDCDIPDIDIGGGRTLGSIQRVDLIDSWDAGAARLVAAVFRILGRASAREEHAAALAARTAEESVQRLRAALRDPAGDIVTYELVMAKAEAAHEALRDTERFPTESERLRGSNAEAALFVAEIVHDHLEVLDDLLNLIVTGCAWSQEVHGRVWTRAIERVAQARGEETGMVVLTDVRWFPLYAVMYAGGLAAVRESNYGALRALVIDAAIRDRDERLSLISRSNPWHAFSKFDLVPQVLAFQAAGEDVTPDFVQELRTKRRGNRYTPISDFLHDTLRDRLRPLIPDDTDYSDTFDVFEILLGLGAVDAGIQAAEGTYVSPPHLGRFTWRDRYTRGENRIEDRIKRQFEQEREDWAPLRSGLFGRSIDRAAAAFQSFTAEAAEARGRRW